MNIWLSLVFVRFVVIFFFFQTYFLFPWSQTQLTKLPLFSLSFHSFLLFFVLQEWKILVLINMILKTVGNNIRRAFIINISTCEIIICWYMFIPILCFYKCKDKLEFTKTTIIRFHRKWVVERYLYNNTRLAIYQKVSKLK